MRVVAFTRHTTLRAHPAEWQRGPCSMLLAHPQRAWLRRRRLEHLAFVGCRLRARLLECLAAPGGTAVCAEGLGLRSRRPRLRLGAPGERRAPQRRLGRRPQGLGLGRRALRRAAAGLPGARRRCRLRGRLAARQEHAAQWKSRPHREALGCARSRGGGGALAPARLGDVRRLSPDGSNSRSEFGQGRSSLGLAPDPLEWRHHRRQCHGSLRTHASVNVAQAPQARQPLSGGPTSPRLLLLGWLCQGVLARGARLARRLAAGLPRVFAFVGPVSGSGLAGGHPPDVHGLCALHRLRCHEVVGGRCSSCCLTSASVIT
mmetsp:Transcript_76296/g.198811  ORF Transcript_76296/g.198811 Transcript_76296/m.198811 type:complete len:317 (+) Transcript_76296:869-1819(+)